MGEIYDQDSILSVRRGKGYLVGTSKCDNAFPDYGQRVEVGQGKFGKVAGEFFSRVKGWVFTVESLEPDTINGKWALKVLGEAVLKKVDSL